MPNREAREQAADMIGQAQNVAQRSYDIAKQGLDTAAERVDDLGRFGKERPLLAMGIAFLAGFFVAKTFF